MKSIQNEENFESQPSQNMKFTELKRLDSLTSGTNMLKQSRLHGANNDEVYMLFSQRVLEMATIKRLAQQIQDQITRQRPKIEEEIKTDATKINEIKTEIKKIKKSIGSDSLVSSQSSLVTGDDSQRLNEYEDKLRDLHKRSVAVNAVNFADKKGFLTENQLQAWKNILNKIPPENHAYLSTSLQDLQNVMTVYNDWIQKGEILEKKFKADGKIVVSAQGIELMPSFPDVQIRVQEDQSEDQQQGQLKDY